MTDDWTCWWGTPLLLKDNAAGNHWLEITLQGTACNRDAVGAAITWSARGVRRSRYKSNAGSYLSSRDLREVLGVGQATKVGSLEIEWPLPSGRVERFMDAPIDRYVTIVGGKRQDRHVKCYKSTRQPSQRVSRPANMLSEYASPSRTDPRHA